MQYETDEEKVEAIKRWWKENGVSIAIGVVIGVGAIIGWRAWQGHQESQAQTASATFEQLLAVAQAETDPGAALGLAERLREEFADTPYATLASLILARVAFAEQDRTTAKQALEQALETAPDPALRRIAALRLTRILIAEGDLAGARALIDAHEEAGPFAGEFAMLRGDIALEEGALEQARQAYEAALAAGVSQPRLLEIKLANLPTTG